MILRRQRQRVTLLVIALLFICTDCAHAAGPRWIAGPQWTNTGKPMGWYRADTHYFVDQGPLSPSVDNTTATALVDAAASVWNVQGVNFTLTNGGQLSEDVSGSNVYLGSSGPVWPADVQSSNYSAKQIAVLFDADGSITDTLLGSGASAPSNCRENGVTESVNLFIQPGRIAHALIIVNGRCSGPAPEQQLQLQYQLERVFGRVIGIGWSQTNDNVFTGTPAPIYAQQLHWPIMHPIDILCGPYTYQCLPLPFTLRDDDIGALEMVYATDLNAAPGANQMSVSGRIVFPTGQGMNGVNVTIQRGYDHRLAQTDPYQDVTSVTGFLSRTDVGNPVTGPPTDPNSTGGDSAWWEPGYFLVYGIPSLPYNYTHLYANAEPLNPLYIGPYAVGPYQTGSPAPSGTMAQQWYGYAQPNTAVTSGNITTTGAASECNTSADGTENAPLSVPPDGSWSGRLCGVGHTPWNTFTVRSGRTATIEVTALDETGIATEMKAMPLIGLWHGADPTGTQPTLASAAAPFNSISAGTTQLRASFSANEAIRLAVADQRGDGRPDYTFRARLLYADTVSPARMSPGGGTIRITGTGFTPSSVVTVGGVLATVTSLSATVITAYAPTLAALGNTAVNDVTVTDRATGADTTITGGLTYSGAANDVLTLVQEPPASVAVEASATLIFKLVDGNGNPAPNSTVTVSVTAGAALFSTCGLATCTLLTDASGLTQTQVTAISPGSVQMQATAKSGSSVQASFNATQSSQAITFLRPMEYIAAGSGANFHPVVVLTGNTAQNAPQTVLWASNSPRIQFTAPQSSGSSASVSASGSLNDNEAATVQACAWGNICATRNITGVPANQLQVLTVSGDGQSVSASALLASVLFRVTDASGHPVDGANVSLHQEVTGWQPPCSAAGRCAPAPVYGTSNDTAMSDDDGLITVTPLQYANTAATTKITVAVGTSGAVTATLQKTP